MDALQLRRNAAQHAGQHCFIVLSQHVNNCQALLYLHCSFSASVEGIFLQRMEGRNKKEMESKGTAVLKS